MRLQDPARRPGVTLVEVLAAIFILGVGMLAVLVLFPLGALRMAAALKDDRCGTIAANADAISSMFDLRNAAAVTAVVAPNYTPDAAKYAPADPLGISYPVFVDPYYSPSFNKMGSSDVPRINSPFGAGTARQRAERWFTFLDDLTFQANGEPLVRAGATLERQGRYTWSYMLRRYRSGDAQTTELTVIVYAGRPIEVPVLEETYAVSSPETVQVSDTSLVIRWPIAGPMGTPIQEKPALRRGAWVFDSTYKARSRGGATSYGYYHSEFYKVQEAVEQANVFDAATGITFAQMRLDVQPPLRDARVQQLTVLERAVEVFERGNGRK